MERIALGYFANKLMGRLYPIGFIIFFSLVTTFTTTFFYLQLKLYEKTEELFFNQCGLEG